MKDKLNFMISIIGGFSATIIVAINFILQMAGADTAGYVDIINIVGVVLAVILFVVAVIFLNKYNVLQQKQTAEQNATVTNVLTKTQDILNVTLPLLAEKILHQGQVDSNLILEEVKTRTTTMLVEELPNMSKQTIEIVTAYGQDIIDQTTSKAMATMETMERLIPTYSKQIADNVTQTIRENNAHVSKMMNQLKTLVDTAQVANGSSPIDISAALDSFQDKANEINIAMESNFNNLIVGMENRFATINQQMQELLDKANTQEVPEVPEVPEVEPIPELVDEVLPEEALDAEDAEEIPTQNDEISEKSDETDIL